ncbi:MAG: hypothetical protein AB8B77_08595 [Alphaproteobacteria bacterium]
MKKLFLTTAVTLKSYFFAVTAWASDADWAESITEVAKKGEQGLFSVAIAIFGVLIILAGVVMATTGRIDGGRMFTIIVAGILIAVGPTAVRTLFGWQI